MSEERFKIEFQPSGEVRLCVYAEDFDAQRLRADTAEAELAIIRPERDLYKASSEALEDQWNAAEKRIADGIAYVQKLVDCSKNQDSVATGYLSDILSALNQKSEGESHAK